MRDLLHPSNQHETAAATATRASNAVKASATTNQTNDTQISALRSVDGAEKSKLHFYERIFILTP